MYTFITTALVGTGQQQSKAIGTGTPVDDLVEQLDEGNAERRLLLMAGAWSIYRRAGLVPERVSTKVPPAPPERLSACSPTVLSTLESLLRGQHSEIVPEALSRLQCMGLRLPHELLPAALELGTQQAKLRPALASVVGERGRWLSRFNSAWDWLPQFLPDTERSLPEDAETLWQEGTLIQRQALLRRLRAIDAEQARQWLAAVWKQEKVEARCALLATFEVGLSIEDEPALEKALDDRGERVRSIAASLLARLPTSALAQRMLARADAMLDYMLGTLSISLPAEEEVDKEWQRDGIPARQSARALYIPLLVSLVPPRHWVERFSATPQQLLAAAEMAENGQRVIDSWSYAAMLFADASWAAALWTWWCAHTGSGAVSIRDVPLTEVKKALAASIPQHEAEQCVQKLTPGGEEWNLMLELLPEPWSEQFGAHYLQALQAYISDALTRFRQQEALSWNVQHQMTLPGLSIAALALPYPCFQQALGDWSTLASVINTEEFSNQSRWLIMQWQQALQEFTETIQIRKRLIEEIRS